MRLLRFIALVALVVLASPEGRLKSALMVPVDRGSFDASAAAKAAGDNEQTAAMTTGRPTLGGACGRSPCPNKDKMCEVICKNHPLEGGKICK
jgi:hypothetical protein